MAIDPALDQPDEGGDRTRRARPLRPLPTDRIRFEKQLDLLRAYAALYETSQAPVSYKDAAPLVGLSPPTVSLATAYFVDVGLVTRDDKTGGIVPSEAVRRYQHDRAFEVPEATAALRLGEVLRSSWIYETLRPYFDLGKRIPVAVALAEFSSKASAPGEYRGQVEAILPFLLVSGLAKREGDDLVRGEASPRAAHAPALPAPARPDPTPPPTKEERHFDAVRRFPIPFIGKEPGEIVVPEDLAESDCILLDAMVAVVRAYAKQRQEVRL